MPVAYRLNVIFKKREHNVIFSYRIGYIFLTCLFARDNYESKKQIGYEKKS